MSKKIIFILFLIFFLFFLIFKNFSQKTKNFETVEVVRGNVFEEILEPGIVEKGEEIKLTFRMAGRIEKIFVKSGEEVEAKEVLAKLDTKDLEIQLKEAETALELAKANYEKLLAGVTPQEREIAKKEVDAATSAFLLAEKNLKDSFQAAKVVLDNAYITIYNASNFVKYLAQKYISFSDESSRKIMFARDKIDAIEYKITYELESLKENYSEEKIKNVLSETKSSLEIILQELETIRRVINESLLFRESVSLADKTALDTYKVNINQTLSNIIGAIQNISSGETNFELAKIKLDGAKNRLNLLTSPPRQTDINVYQLQIQQAELKIEFLKNQLNESELKAPFSGKIMRILKKEGEMIQPLMGEFVFILLPKAEFQIKTDIYEKDIVKIKEGMTVEVSFISFPNQTFLGKISFIEPAPKIKDGVIYYETTIELENYPEDLRTGMTADVKIKTSQKENVLVLKREALKREAGKYYVELLKNGKIQKTIVEIGTGEDMVEIVSGLNEGERVLLR